MLTAETTAPAMLSLGQLIKVMMSPMKPSRWLMQDYLIRYLFLSILPRMQIAQIINEQTPLYRNIVQPPPPSKVFSPYVIIAEQRLQPTVMMGPIMKQACQQSKSPAKSSRVSSTAKPANTDRIIRMAVIWKLEEKPLKQLSQKVPKRMLVCAATERARRRVTMVNMDSLLKGEYMRVNPRMRVRLSETRVLLEVPLVEVVMVVSVLLPKMPMKRTATTQKIITMNENIIYYYQQVIELRASLEEQPHPLETIVCLLLTHVLLPHQVVVKLLGLAPVQADLVHLGLSLLHLRRLLPKDPLRLRDLGQLQGRVVDINQD